MNTTQKISKKVKNKIIQNIFNSAQIQEQNKKHNKLINNFTNFIFTAYGYITHRLTSHKYEHIKISYKLITAHFIKIKLNQNIRT